jgi:hypothetical protein
MVGSDHEQARAGASVGVDVGADAAGAAGAGAGAGDAGSDLAWVRKALAHGVVDRIPDVEAAPVAAAAAAADGAWASSRQPSEADREGERYRTDRSAAAVDGWLREVVAEDWQLYYAGAAVTRLAIWKVLTTIQDADAWSLEDRAPCCAGRGLCVLSTIYVWAQDSDSCLVMGKAKG